MQDTLSALAWLVEAGADEAIGETPVDRFALKPKATTNPPLRSNPPLERVEICERSDADFGDGYNLSGTAPPRNLLRKFRPSRRGRVVEMRSATPWPLHVPRPRFPN